MKNVYQNHVFAEKCTVTLNKVGNMRNRLEYLCTAADGLSDILDDLHSSGNDMADYKAEALKAGDALGMFKSRTIKKYYLVGFLQAEGWYVQID